jgi:enoyl-CoA hydratase/carnithine racemase
MRDDVRAIVLTGAGRGFCAGADMQNLEQIAGGDTERRTDAVDTRPVTFALGIPKPVIAAINGPCAGLGLVHAVMCDLRFAAADAKLTTAFSRRGLVAEHGISWMLPRLVGPARALDLLLSGRVVLGAEAAELGLVNRAVEEHPVLEEALDYARMLATECSPASMALMKRQVYGDYERTLAESLEDANQLMIESFSRPDFAEGVRSFVERRSPDFEPLAGQPAGLAS